MDGDVKEIYHRLKNHLAVVNSLLRLKASGQEDETARAALEEAGGLVSAVTLVYQLLYQGGGTEGVSASWYLRELLDLLEQTLSRPLPLSELELPPAGLLLSPDKAVPLGILTAELYISASGAGMPDSGAGGFGLAMTESGKTGVDSTLDESEGWHLLFRGISPEVRDDLILTEALAAQLEGKELAAENSDEPVYRLIFPANLLFSENTD